MSNKEANNKGSACGTNARGNACGVRNFQVRNNRQSNNTEEFASEFGVDLNAEQRNDSAQVFGQRSKPKRKDSPVSERSKWN